MMYRTMNPGATFASPRPMHFQINRYVMSAALLFIALSCQTGCWADFPEAALHVDATAPRDAHLDQGIEEQAVGDQAVGDQAVGDQGDATASDQRLDIPAGEGLSDAHGDGDQTVAHDGGPDVHDLWPAGDVFLSDATQDRSPLADATVDTHLDALSAETAVDALPADSTVDALPADSTVDTVLPVDSTVDTFHCTPNAFIACATATSLTKCNALGTGTVSVTCSSPFLCSASHGTCTECQPSMTPFCATTTTLKSCASDGFYVETSCAPLTCENDACCTNVDNDSYTSCQGDCNDHDARVYPGQTTYFVTPSAGSYDYNCSGVEEKRYPSKVNCQMNNNRCEGEGWGVSVPACGQSGTYYGCNKVPQVGCVKKITGSQRTQACR